MKSIVMGGCGKVGSAIVNILSDAGNNVDILDIDGDFVPKTETCHFLHVTIPFSKTFISSVKRVARKYNPDHIVIHSTVPVGTTRKIGINACHSPVRGQHNNLEDSIRKFTKYVASVSVSTGDAVEEHLKKAGLKIQQWQKPEETELMKLLCLSRFLNELAFYEVADSLCKKYKVFNGRLTSWTETFNEGYKGTSFRRSELKFPNGVAGGTCVLPVSKMLYEQTKNEWLYSNIATFEPKPCKKK